MERRRGGFDSATYLACHASGKCPKRMDEDRLPNKGCA